MVPRHYYGEFTKGNAEAVVSANMDKPMGSGPYIWQGYADNIVTCVANDNFFLGKPYIKTVKWQVYTDEDILAAFVAGDIDIANPTLNKDKLQAYIDAGLHYDLVDNNGYGYLGINSNNVEKLVRQGFMHLLNRKPSVEGYYGTMAQLIERPMTTTLAEYPDEAKEYYGYDPQKALAKFKEAGYEQKDGKLVKNGQQLVLNVYIGGEGIGDHPGYAMLTQAANDLKNMGGELIIHDVQFSVLQAAMNSGEADIFVLAWGTVTTCDQRSQYMTGGGQNRTNISNKELDNILEQIVVTMDLKKERLLLPKHWISLWKKPLKCLFIKERTDTFTIRLPSIFHHCLKHRPTGATKTFCTRSSLTNIEEKGLNLSAVNTAERFIIFNNSRNK